MPRPANPVPTYRHHKQSDQAIVTLRGRDGRRKDVLLGRYNSLESREAYLRILAEINAHGAAEATTPPLDSISINEMILAYWRHAEQHYRHADGRPTSEIVELRCSLRVLKELYGLTPATAFGPRKLATLRDSMIRRGWCRTLINRRIDRIRRAFKWATAEELVSVTVFQALRALPGLRAGRSEARESSPVLPVPIADFESTLPHLALTSQQGPHFWQMVSKSRIVSSHYTHTAELGSHGTLGTWDLIPKQLGHTHFGVCCGA